MTEHHHKCYNCDSLETKFCPLCDKWMCDSCRKDYPNRIKGFINEKVLGKE